MPEIKKDCTDYKKKIVQIKTKIISNEKLAPLFYKMTLLAAAIARNSLSGQFVTIRVTDGYEPFLRRPFSIHRVSGTRLEILFKVVGEATKILSRKKKGQNLDVLGPLGNGFTHRGTRDEGRETILVAGGIGVAPLLFLAERLISHHVTMSPCHQLKVLIGARTRKEILCEKELKELGCGVKIATDDGSAGFKGPVTSLLKKILLATRYSLLATIYACGPKPMLEEIATLSRKFNIPAQGSLEAHMACGTGACMGCIVETRVGYKRVCLEGPVFDLKEIKW